VGSRITTGTCLCGAVRLTVRTKTDNFGACHCSMCRTWGGGPLLAVECEPDADVDGRDNVTVFESSDWAERAFCSRCGTHLYYRLKLDGHHAVPLGLFGDDRDWKFSEQIFVDEKPPCYAFANDTKDMTGAEVFALFAPPE